MTLAQLRAQRGKLADELIELAATGTESDYNTKKGEMDDLDGRIRRVEEAQTRAAELARPVDGTALPTNDDLPPERAYASTNGYAVEASQVRNFNSHVRAYRRANNMVIDPAQHFRTLGEQLLAVATDALQARTGRPNTDARLVRAPTGASEVDPTGGGFLVQTDFAEAIFMLAHDMGEILGRVNKIPISDNANGLKIRGIDETSRATGSRWGGVQSYYVGEGTTVTPTKPKFRLIEFDLKKLFSIMYMTDELLQDSTALSAIASQAFSEEIMFMTEDSIWEGSGAGVPFGIMNSPALITVAKEAGQAAASIVKENIDNMWSRCWSRSRKNAIWFYNQDIEPIAA